MLRTLGCDARATPFSIPHRYLLIACDLLTPVPCQALEEAGKVHIPTTMLRINTLSRATKLAVSARSFATVVPSWSNFDPDQAIAGTHTHE